MTSKRLLFVLALLGLAFLWPWPEDYTAVPQSFRHGKEALSGDLLLPTSPGPHPLVILVHGDGPMPRDGFGYYRPLQTALARAGYASFSWDKPGVGASSGNWEAQSMQERTDEVLAAARQLRQRPDIDRARIGLWGISQAGWVMPLALARDPQLAFMISVSGAVNWTEQSRYLTGERLRQEGYLPQQIQTALRWNRQVNDWLQAGVRYPTYLQRMAKAPPGCQEPMSEARWYFAMRNLNADVRTHLPQVRVPVLALFGAYDRNVDVTQSLSVYRTLLHQSGDPRSAVRLFPNADHGLIPATGPIQIDGRSSLRNLLRLLRIEVLGELAFAADFIDAQLDWLRHVAPPAAVASRQSR